MESGSTPVELSGKNAFRSGEGGRGDGDRPLGGIERESAGEVILRCCRPFKLDDGAGAWRLLELID